MLLNQILREYLGANEMKEEWREEIGMTEHIPVDLCKEWPLNQPKLATVRGPGEWQWWAVCKTGWKVVHRHDTTENLVHIVNFMLIQKFNLESGLTWFRKH